MRLKETSFKYKTMFVLINILMCFCGVVMCLSSSPVQSVIFLILSFCCAAIILFMFHVEFIGLIFIIIYVGAIAVLFLFVIMMLNVKNQDTNENNENYYKFDGVISSIVIGSFSIPSFFIYKYIYYVQYGSYKEKFFLTFLEIDNTSEVTFLIDELLNIEVIGQVLFNNYIVCVLLAGIILLIALVGSIVLTLKFNNSEKSQIANRQLARNENFITFFK